MQLTLPCGYLTESGEVLKEVELDEITGYEEDILGDSSKAKTGLAVDEVLSRCMKRLGAIKPEKPVRGLTFVPHLEGMLMTDRTFLMIRLRQLSLGDTFVFETKCPSCKFLHKRVTVNLSELDVKEMEDPTKTSWVIKIPSGKMITYKALTGKDEHKLIRIKKEKKEDFFSALLMLRITHIDGEPLTSISKVKSLSTKDRDFLRGQFDKFEGGIDTTIQMECSDCGNEWDLQLPVGDRSFFFPSGISA